MGLQWMMWRRQQKLNHNFLLVGFIQMERLCLIVGLYKYRSNICTLGTRCIVCSKGTISLEAKCLFCLQAYTFSCQALGKDKIEYKIQSS